jgi:hypothetical protein
MSLCESLARHFDENITTLAESYEIEVRQSNSRVLPFLNHIMDTSFAFPETDITFFDSCILIVRTRKVVLCIVFVSICFLIFFLIMIPFGLIGNIILNSNNYNMRTGCKKNQPLIEKKNICSDDARPLVCSTIDVPDSLIFCCLMYGIPSFGVFVAALIMLVSIIRFLRCKIFNTNSLQNNSSDDTDETSLDEISLDQSSLDEISLDETVV